MDLNFNGLRFPPEEIEMNDSAENCYKIVVRKAYENLKKGFFRWYSQQCHRIGNAPCLIVPMFLTYLPQAKIVEQNKDFQKYRIEEIDKTINFLKEYKKLLKGKYETELKGPTNEVDCATELLVKYNICGFGECQTLTEDDRKLREMLANCDKESNKS